MEKFLEKISDSDANLPREAVLQSILLGRKVDSMKYIIAALIFCMLVSGLAGAVKVEQSSFEGTTTGYHITDIQDGERIRTNDFKGMTLNFNTTIEVGNWTVGDFYLVDKFTICVNQPWVIRDGREKIVSRDLYNTLIQGRDFEGHELLLTPEY